MRDTNKHNKKEKSKKSKKEREKEKNKKKKEKKELFENNYHIGDRNKQSKDSFINTIFKNENFIVNKEIKSRKIDEKKSSSEKKKVYNTIGKNKEQKNEENNYENESNLYFEDGKINNNNKKLEKNKEKIQTSKKRIERDDKDEKNIGKNIYEYKYHYNFYENYKRDTCKENKEMLDNLKIQRIQRKYTKNNKNKIYNFYIFLFIISKVFLSHFIKCSHRKIELSSSYINLKTMGSRDIKVYSDEYKGDKPDVIIINNKINLTKNEIRNTHNFENSGNNINNITLIWNNPLNSTSQMFRGCDNIIEIDFSNFDASSVTDMFCMLYYCKSLISLDFSNFNTSSVKNMGGMFEYSYRLYS